MLARHHSYSRCGLVGAALLAGLVSWAGAQNSFTYGSTPWPLIPEPPRSQVQWVSDDMRINGVPMRVQSFESKASKEEVVAFYASHWRAGSADSPVAVTPAGADTLVGRPHGPFYLMAKVRAADGGGAQGTLSVSQVEGIAPRIDASGIPVPANGAQAVNVVESNDAGKRNKQVIWLTKGSSATVAAQYHSTLTRAGWALLQEQSAPASKETALVRMYSKDKRQLDVVIGVDTQRAVTVINTSLVTFGS